MSPDVVADVNAVDGTAAVDDPASGVVLLLTFLAMAVELNGQNATC